MRVARHTSVARTRQPRALRNWFGPGKPRSHGVRVLPDRAMSSSPLLPNPMALAPRRMRTAARVAAPDDPHGRLAPVDPANPVLPHPSASPPPGERVRRGRPAASSTDGFLGLAGSLDPLRVAVVLLLVLTIGRLHEHFAFLVPLRPALLTAGIAIGWIALHPESIARNGILRTWPSRVIAGLLVVAVLSGVFGISFGQSMSFISSTYSKVLILWLLLALAMRTVADLRLMVWAYIGGVGFLVYLSVFVYQMTEQYGSLSQRLDDENAYMYDPNDLGVIMLSALPLLLHLFVTSKRVGKLVSALLILGIGYSTARAGSRGALVGLVAVGAMLLFMVRGVSVIRRLTFVSVVVVGMVVAAPAGYWDQMSTILQPKADYNWDAEDGRMKIWKRGAGYMARYPLFGVGISNFGRADGTISDKAKYHVPGTPIVFVAPHNSFVQAGAELGVPGLLLWSSLSFGALFGMLRMRRRLPPAWEQGTEDERFLFHLPTYLAIACGGFVVTSSFVSFAYLDPVYILAAYTSAAYALVAQRLPALAAGGRRARVQLPARQGGRQA